MTTIHSSDGTPIAYETTGDGPAVILVDGALCYRASGPNAALAARLAEHFTVFTYDRRGRGESGDATRYDVEREVEDLEAVIQAAGGSASVYGISSGAALALEAARCGTAIEKLALYEPPFIVDDSRPPIAAGYREQLGAHVAAGRRGDAVRLFMRQVGVPRIFIALMRLMPAWPKLKGVAHTLAYDAAVMADTQRGEPLPAERWSAVTTPTLVVAGGKSPAWMQRAADELAATLSDADRQTLPGQTHMVSAKALAPVLTGFFSAPALAQAA